MKKEFKKVFEQIKGEVKELVVLAAIAGVVIGVVTLIDMGLRKILPKPNLDDLEIEYNEEDDK